MSGNDEMQAKFPIPANVSLPISAARLLSSLVDTSGDQPCFLTAQVAFTSAPFSMLRVS